MAGEQAEFAYVSLSDFVRFLDIRHSQPNLAPEDSMTAQRARITEGGHVVIPAEFRRQLDMQPGADVILHVTDGELRIRSLRRAIERAQTLVRLHVPADTSLGDELINERRDAARRE